MALSGSQAQQIGINNLLLRAKENAAGNQAVADYVNKRVGDQKEQIALAQLQYGSTPGSYNGSIWEYADGSGGNGGNGGDGGEGGGGGGGEGYSGEYSGAISDIIAQGLAQYNDMLAYAKQLMQQATEKSPYEDIYKGKYDTYNTEEADWYNKLKQSASLIPTEETKSTIQEILNPQYAKIREQKDEALRQYDAMQALAHRDVNDPEVARERAKIAKQYDSAEQDLYSQYLYQYPRDEYNVLQNMYGTLSNQAMSYLSGATSLDEARKNRMAGGSGSYLSSGTNMYGTTLGGQLDLQRLAQQQSQFDSILDWSKEKWNQEVALARELANQYQDMYDDNNSWWNKLLGVGGSILGTALGGPVGGLIGGGISSLFGGSSSSATTPNYSWIYNKSGGSSINPTNYVSPIFSW